jgi:hypothetical protein
MNLTITQMVAVYACVKAIVNNLELRPEGVYKAKDLDLYFTTLERGLLKEYLAEWY